MEAVHFAIALHHYGMLNVSSRVEDPLLSTDGGDASGAKTYLNFHFLISDYVKLFAHTDPRDAVSYINLIEDVDIKINFLKDLVIKSKDPSTLVGSVDQFGRKKVCIVNSPIHLS